MELPCLNAIENAIMKVLRVDKDDDDWNDEEFWSVEGSHGSGSLSYATVTAHSRSQDFSHVQVGPGTFFAVYDGHHGHEAAEFASQNVFDRIVQLALKRKELSEDVFRDTITDVDNWYVDMATEKGISSDIGACCAVGLIWGRTLCVADMGDSLIVSGRHGGKVLTEDRQQWIPGGVISIREEPFDPLSEIQPDDDHVFHDDGKAWRFAGAMPVWKCIGDGYVKLDDPKERVHVATYTLDGDLDRFLICATHGLWEHLPVEKAVEIVQSTENKNGIARKLAREAMKRAVAGARRMRYRDLKHLKGGERRTYHDDMTVIVVFLGRLKDPVDDYYTSRMVEPYMKSDAPSVFNRLHGIKFVRNGGTEPTAECSGDRD